MFRLGSLERVDPVFIVEMQSKFFLGVNLIGKVEPTACATH